MLKKRNYLKFDFRSKIKKTNQKYYNPSRDIVVDESIIKFKFIDTIQDGLQPFLENILEEDTKCGH